jgi:hypothetical protein
MKSATAIYMASPDKIPIGDDLSIDAKFPHDSEDFVIEKTIRDLSMKILHYNADNIRVLKFSPLIQTGQIELLKRQILKTSKQAARAECLAIGIAILSLIISVVNWYMSHNRNVQDSVWQENVLKELQELNRKSSST